MKLTAPVGETVGQMHSGMGRHPHHTHMIVFAPQHVSLTTHLCVADSPFFGSNAVFGLRPSLAIDFDSDLAGKAADDHTLDAPYWSAHGDSRPNAQSA